MKASVKNSTGTIVWTANLIYLNKILYIVTDPDGMEKNVKSTNSGTRLVFEIRWDHLELVQNVFERSWQQFCAFLDLSSDFWT